MLGIIIGVWRLYHLALAGAPVKDVQQIQQMGTNVLVIMSGQSRAGPLRRFRQYGDPHPA